MWVKKWDDSHPDGKYLWAAGVWSSGNTNTGQYWTGPDKLASTHGVNAQNNNGGTTNPPNYFRDPSAWFHLVVRMDTANASNSNRHRVYVNGELIATASSVTQNFEGAWNRNVNHAIGGNNNHGTYSDVYISEVHNVDGQSLDPTAFGEYDSNGIWRPIAYNGSYGTNGFYLKMDPSASNGVGHDHSGNGNHFTATGFDLTSSSAYYCVVTDTPSNNHAILNGLFQDGTISQGALNTNASEWNYQAGAGIYVDPTSNGKYYLEVQASGSGTYFRFATPNSYSAPSFEIRSNGSDTFINGSRTTNAGGWSGNTWVGFGIDYPNQQVVMWKSNNTTQTWSFSGLSGWDTQLISAGFRHYYDNGRINFGQLPFQRNSTIPSGWVPWNTASLPDVDVKKPTDYFNTVLYTGNSSNNHAITGVGFQPDLVWIKDRNVTGHDHVLTDSSRGTSAVLRTNTGLAEYTQTDGITSFDSDGFTLGDDNSVGQAGNFNSNNAHVAFCWKKSATAGFDIVTYTGTSATTMNISHSLGVKPAFMIVKNRDNSYNWDIYHQSGGYNASLIFTNAASRSGAFGGEPTSSHLITQISYTHNNGQDYVGYLWAEVAGFSRFGRYSGNGSTNGTFVPCGFRPAMIMVKNTQGGDWRIFDDVRDTYNVMSKNVIPNSSSAEGTSYQVDFVSNGFKWRHAGAEVNNGSFYVFAAWARHPFGGANVSPTPAR